MNQILMIAALLMAQSYKEVRAGGAPVTDVVSTECTFDDMVVTISQRHFGGPQNAFPVDYETINPVDETTICQLLNTSIEERTVMLRIPLDDCGTVETTSPDGDRVYVNTILAVLKVTTPPVRRITQVQCTVYSSVSIECEPDKMVATVNQSALFSHSQRPSEFVIQYTLSADDSACPTVNHNLTEDVIEFEIPLIGCGIKVIPSDDGTRLLSNTTLAVSVISTPTEITLHRDWTFSLTCAYNRTERLHAALNPNTLAEEDVLAYGRFVFTMVLYNEDNSPLPTSEPVEVSLGETLRVEVTVTQAINLSLYLDECWATPTQDSSFAIYYTLISTGCAMDVGYSCSNQNDTQQFFVNVFRFVPAEQFSTVYIHCNVKVCSLEAADSACDCPNCGTLERRRRRSQERQDAIAYDKGSNVYEVTIGPIVKADKDGGQKDAFDKGDEEKVPMMGLIIGLVSGFVVIVIIVVTVIFVMRKRKQQAPLTVERNKEVSLQFYKQAPGMARV